MVPGSVVWILTQGWGWDQEAGLHPEPVSLAAGCVPVTFSKGLSQAVPAPGKRWVMAPSLPGPRENIQNFLRCSAYSAYSHQSFVAKDVPYPLPEA